MKQKKWKYLDEYVQSYKDHDGYSEIPGCLPKLVVYFRIALDKLGIYDSYVPEYFGWDDYHAEDFLSWGHNSRWNHTFNCQLYGRLNKYVRMLKQDMNQAGIPDFDIGMPPNR